MKSFREAEFMVQMHWEDNGRFYKDYEDCVCDCIDSLLEADMIGINASINLARKFGIPTEYYDYQ